MKLRHRALLFASLATLTLMSTSTTQAEGTEVYRYIDAQGNVVFTDEPRAGAETIKVAPVATMPALKVPKPDPRQDEAEQKTETGYSSVKITSPDNEQNFINNMGTVTIEVALTPPRRAGDRLQLYFNGQAQGAPQAGTLFPFENLDRGTYIAQVSVVDANGKALAESEPVTFFVRRPSINQPRR